jgi:hypothetical protein
MIQTQLFLALISDPDVSDLIGSRIYPMRAPQKAPMPAVVYQIIAGTPVSSLDGDSGLDNIRLQLTVWANRYAEAVDLAAVVRRAISTASSLKSITLLVVETEDKETASYGVITDYSMWSVFAPSVASALSKFIRVPFEGNGIINEISLPSAIAENGFYLVSLNGRIAQETVEYTINAARNKITFTNTLAGGSYKDEGIIIYQEVPSPDFEQVAFEGDGVTTEIELDSPIIEDGFYFVVLNGRVAKEGVTYEVNGDRDKIIFNTPLEGGDNKDEGVVIYQKS